MATRSTIAVEHADGTVGQIYVHWDGYIEHNGMILHDNYSNYEDAAKLISNGHLSVLGECIEGCEILSDREDGNGNISYFYKSIEDFNQNMIGEEYDYLWKHGESRWYVSDNYNDEGWVLLENEILQIREDD